MNAPTTRIRINNLQYNANRDPQFYRRLPNQPFRVEVDVAGKGTATVRLEVENEIKEQKLELPGKFDCQVSFSTPKSRIGVIIIERDGKRVTQNIRFDVMDHEWIG